MKTLKPLLITVSITIFVLLLSIASNSIASQANESQQTIKTFALEEASIADVHHAMANGELTCIQLLKAYLKRIKAYNLSVIGNQPPLNAIVEINPFLFAYARALDQAYAQTKTFIGPLHCIPILVKDNIDTFDGTATSGSLALLGNQPPHDADLVQKLRRAGAIIIAKSTMDEFAAGLAGISSRSGRVGNSYDTTQNPGGSSSGSAVGVSANFAMLGVGTDNSGSVRVPAALNGLVGLRPSMGLISQQSIFPRGNQDGTAGPIARTVEDLSQLLDIIAQREITASGAITSYTTCLKQENLQGLAIGIVTRVGSLPSYANMPAAVKDHFNAATQTLAQLGAKIIPDIDLSLFNRNRKLNEAGEYDDINQYLASFPATRKDYRDICMSNRTRSFGDSVKACLQFIAHLPPQSASAKVQALFEKNKKYVEDIMEKNHLDALLIPVTTQGSATYDVDSFRNEVLASNAGLPGLTFTIAYTEGAIQMPIGVELVGRKFSECTLITIAHAYEQKRGARKPPTLPVARNELQNLSIAKYNHLLTNIGYDTYQKVLKNTKSKNIVKVLTGERFAAIVTDNLHASMLHTN